MQTGSIRPGDILHCDVRGYLFYARAKTSVTEQVGGGRRGIEIEPLKENQHLVAAFVTARQIVGHYAKRKGSR